jgi:hypothetical protein
MATLSVRHGQVDLVREGLVALALEAGTGSDQRDSMVSLALLYHSAVKLGMNVQAAFSQAALLAPASFEGAIRLFPNRPPRQLDLEAWGFKEATTKDGFGYQLR